MSLHCKRLKLQIHLENTYFLLPNNIWWFSATSIQSNIVHKTFISKKRFYIKNTVKSICHKWRSPFPRHSQGSKNWNNFGKPNILCCLIIFDTVFLPSQLGRRGVSPLQKIQITDRNPLESMPFLLLFDAFQQRSLKALLSVKLRHRHWNNCWYFLCTWSYLTLFFSQLGRQGVGCFICNTFSEFIFPETLKAFVGWSYLTLFFCPANLADGGSGSRGGDTSCEKGWSSLNSMSLSFQELFSLAMSLQFFNVISRVSLIVNVAAFLAVGTLLVKKGLSLLNLMSMSFLEPYSLFMSLQFS